MLNNKDKLFLARFQESMREFVAEDVGKAARADLRALEVAAGGKKKLAEADRLLVDARRLQALAKTAYATAISEGHSEAEPVLLAAEKVLATAKAERDRSNIEILDSQHDLGVAQRASIATAQKLKEREKIVGDAEAANAALRQKLDSKESCLTNLERELEARAARFKEAAA